MSFRDIFTDATGSAGPSFTFEYFPAKTPLGMANLVERMGSMKTLGPQWIDITWHAGGHSQAASLLLAQEARAMGLHVCLHMTSTNVEVARLNEALDVADKTGVGAILALRGDPPRHEEYADAGTELTQFEHSIDLAKYIKNRHGDRFLIGMTGYPEGHPDTGDMHDDIKWLVEKQKAGADFVMTQMFYDIDKFSEWYRGARAAGVSIPIIPGIMPIQNYQAFRRVANLSRVHLPEWIIDDLLPIHNDDAKVRGYGVGLAADMIIRIHESLGIPVFNMFTLNLDKSTRRILKKVHAKIDGQMQSTQQDTQPKSVFLAPKGSEISHASGVFPSKPLTYGERTWDEFPNGRLGDARSPAFGDIDGYGTSLKQTPDHARQLWGFPVDAHDVSNVFSKYLTGAISANPWSEVPLHDETGTIVDHLINYVARAAWWPLSSQPAVNGVPSADPVYGFGPPGGFVYQKAYVEFFIPRADLARVEALAVQHDPFIKFYAADSSGTIVSNMAKDGVNAVTWATFIGQEVVTATMIEEMNFSVWAEEAFSVWTEWARVYPAGSASRKFLEHTRDSLLLVTLVHHDYVKEGALWDCLDRAL